MPLADRPTRTQQAFDGTAIPSGMQIDALGFRRDDADTGAATYAVDVEILLGHTLTPPPALSPTFDSNWDAAGPTQVVCSPALPLPAVLGLPRDADRFDFIIPLATPFTTGTSASRHLLCEIRVLSHTRGSAPFGLWLDATCDPINYARVWTQSLPFAATGSIDRFAPAMSLISSGSGTASPRLDFGGSLSLGGTFDVVLRGAPALAPASLVHGLSATLLGMLPLPLDLGFAGASGCVLGTSTDVALPAQVNATGQAFVRLTVTNSPALIGYEFFNQFVILDAAANALGITTTEVGFGRVGG
jgi:hypothetical protein